MTMSYWKPNTRQKVHEARRAIAGARSGLSALTRNHSEAVRTIRNRKPDPDLSAEGQRKTNERDLARVQEEAQAALGRYLRDVEEAERVLESVARTAPGADAGAVARREAHWRRAQTLLASGRTPAEVVALTSDPEQLLALREELPTYLLAQNPGRDLGDSPEFASGSVLMVDRRLAEVAEGDEATFAKARLALGSEVPVARVHLDNAGAQLAGRQAATATAIAVDYAEQTHGLKEAVQR